MKAETDVVGYWIPYFTYFLGRAFRHGGWYPAHQLRLFNRQDVKFNTRKVHEGYLVKDKPARFGMPGTKTLLNHIHHYTYDNLEIYFEKFNRYTTFDAEEMARTGKDKLSGKKIRLNPNNFLSVLWFLSFRPKLWFLKRYLRKLGFLDGIHGLIYAILGTMNEFVGRVKYWHIIKKGKS